MLKNFTYSHFYCGRHINVLPLDLSLLVFDFIYTAIGSFCNLISAKRTVSVVWSILLINKNTIPKKKKVHCIFISKKKNIKQVLGNKPFLFPFERLYWESLLCCAYKKKKKIPRLGGYKQRCMLMVRDLLGGFVGL